VKSDAEGKDERVLVFLLDQWVDAYMALDTVVQRWHALSTRIDGDVLLADLWRSLCVTMPSLE